MPSAADELGRQTIEICNDCGENSAENSGAPVNAQYIIRDRVPAATGDARLAGDSSQHRHTHSHKNSADDEVERLRKKNKNLKTQLEEA